MVQWKESETMVLESKDLGSNFASISYSLSNLGYIGHLKSLSLISSSAK